MLKEEGMFTSPIRSAVTVALMAAFAITGSACYVEEEAGPPEYADGYTPEYYDGYVVYYDDVGRPYYYANGAIIWVPPTSPVYVRLVNHWRYYGPAYHRWYAHHGYRYRGYRGGQRHYR
jgi:hypothetical protein